MTQRAYPPAGRDLDRLVAERLMGYRTEPWITGDEVTHWLLVAPDNEWVSRGGEDGPHLWRNEVDAWADCPEFSTDIAAAWLVRDEIKRRWGGLVIRDEPGVLEVSVIRHPRSYFDCDVPAAICLAALWALDATVGEREE